MTLLLIPLLPLLSFAVLILYGRRLGALAPAVSLTALMGSLLLSVRLFLLLHGHPETLPTSLLLPFWIPLGADHSVGQWFLADALSVTMCLVVTVVGWLIMLYSIGYMHGDPRFPRFFAYLSLFFSGMLILVLAGHFVLLYVGWELVGLCSYLLISFWFEKPAAANAGRKAFLTTRVGDLGLLAAILAVAKLTGDLGFADLPARALALGDWAPWVAVLIFWGAAGKSAQFPLHVWLPDAMEGPTPVSALIHAATMVAAGVYLVARTLPLFLPNPQALLTVAGIGLFTSFFAATVACTQTDLKKILAYSTISQLGLMMLGLGAGSASAGMFHLVTHACFKALLFLGAGSVIHALHHQEITRMGGVWRKMPVTAATFTLGAVAMAGIPPFSGFWSKEEILLAVSRSLPPGFLYMAMVVSGLTAFYISRAVILVFFGKPRVIPAKTGDPRVREGPRLREDDIHGASRSYAHESPAVMTGPLVVLAAGAAGVGLLGSPWAGHALQHFLGAEPSGAHVGSHGFTHVPSLAAGIGMLLAFLRYGLGWPLLPEGLRASFRPAYRWVAHTYYVDEAYDFALLQPIQRIAQRASSFDAGVIDGAVNGVGETGLRASRLKQWVDERVVDGLVNGVGAGFGWAGGALRLIQTGLVQNYLLIASAGALAIFFLLR